jgi:hypothetical protein
MDAPLSPRNIPHDCLEYAGIRDPDTLPSLKRMDQETAARLQVIMKHSKRSICQWHPE